MTRVVSPDQRTGIKADPALRSISIIAVAGHRNREVYEHLELTHDVRDSRAAAIYSA